MKLKFYYVRRVSKTTEEITNMRRELQYGGLGFGDGGYPPIGTIVMIEKNSIIGGLIEVFISDKEAQDARIKKALPKIPVPRPGWEETKKELREGRFVEVEICRYHIRGKVGEGWAEIRAYVTFFTNNKEVLGDLC
jgi:hypothetical protein